VSGPATRLWLADALLDLDRPVEVVRAGESVFAGNVERTLEVVLEWLDERGAPFALPTARVSLG